MFFSTDSFTDVRRSYGYLSDLRWTSDGLLVKRTNARIRFNAAFISSFVSAVKIYLYMVVLGWSRRLRRGRPEKSIAFYPQSAPPWYNIWNVAKMAGLRIESDRSKADILFVFDDSTYRSTPLKLNDAQALKAINLQATNISKAHVAKVFESVFGYQLAIDPTTYRGLAICKSEMNGTHDGEVVACPLPAEAIKPGYAYQILVDSTFDGTHSEDLRFVFAGDSIPVVFHKKKRIAERFGTHYRQVLVKTPDDVFSADEHAKLIAFCREMGLEFGAVDAMRDKQSGRLYVVDVNKTCMPVLCLPLGEQMKTYRRIADAFTRETPSES